MVFLLAPVIVALLARALFRCAPSSLPAPLLRFVWPMACCFARVSPDLSRTLLHWLSCRAAAGPGEAGGGLCSPRLELCVLRPLVLQAAAAARPVARPRPHAAGVRHGDWQQGSGRCRAACRAASPRSRGVGCSRVVTAAGRRPLCWARRGGLAVRRRVWRHTPLPAVRRECECSCTRQPAAGEPEFGRPQPS